MVAGFAAWSILGIVEMGLERRIAAGPPACAIGAVAPWEPAVVILGYGIAGALLSWAAGRLLAFARPGELSAEQGEKVAVLVLTSVVATLAATQPWVGWRSRLGLACLAGGLALFNVVSLARPGWRPLHALPNPWLVSLLVVGLPWCLRQQFHGVSHGGRASGVAAFTAAALGLLVALWFAQRRLPLLRPVCRPRSAAAAGGVALSGALVLSGGLWWSPTPRGPAATPNVVLVVLDTARADRLSVYGHERPTTPYLEKLARQATLFERALATSDTSLPSHAALFTGRYPTALGFSASGRLEPLHDSHETLAETLSASGYRSIGVTANGGFLSRDFNLHQGFGQYVVVGPSCCGATPRSRLKSGRPFQPIPPFAPGEDVAAMALELLAPRREPFFLFVNLMDAHEPYRLDLVADTNPLAQRYESGLAAADRAVATLVAWLEARGLLQRTLLVVTSDHGQYLGEDGVVGHHGRGLHQAVLHVPLIVKFPGQSAPERRREPASSLDIVPTVLEALGLERPMLHGRSLRSISDAERSLMAEGYVKRRRGGADALYRALFQGPWKYVVGPDGKDRLHRLDQDPLEKADLTESEGARKDAMSRDLRRLVTELQAQQPAAKPGALDDAARERLRALGYVE